jgi:hypothetical protein
MAKWRWIAVGLLAGGIGAAVTGSRPVSELTLSAQAASRVFELRTYAANPGKFEAMKTRFRQHVVPLFRKHNMTVIGFWTYADPPASANTLAYILAHESRAAAEKNWAAFIADPVRLQVWADTEKDGPLNLKVDTVFLNPIDFSPIK